MAEWASQFEGEHGATELVRWYLLCCGGWCSTGGRDWIKRCGQIVSCSASLFPRNTHPFCRGVRSFPPPTPGTKWLCARSTHGNRRSRRLLLPGNVS